MEAYPECVRRLAGSEQERAYVLGLGAELGAEAELRMLIVHLQADEQVKIGRRNAVSRGRADDLVQFLDRVEAEGLHAMLKISLGNGLFGLHGVHEAEDGLRKRLVDEADLADRRDVEMRDASSHRICSDGEGFAFTA